MFNLNYTDIKNPNDLIADAWGKCPSFKGAVIKQTSGKDIWLDDEAFDVELIFGNEQDAVIFELS
jgi:hypothetical protein